MPLPFASLPVLETQFQSQQLTQWHPFCPPWGLWGPLWGDSMVRLAAAVGGWTRALGWTISLVAVACHKPLLLLCPGGISLWPPALTASSVRCPAAASNWWKIHGCFKKLLTRTILWFPTPELHPVSANMAIPLTFKEKLPYIFPKKSFSPLKYNDKANFLVSAGNSLLVQITFAVGSNVMLPFEFSWPATTSFLKWSAVWVCSIKPCLMSTVDVLEAEGWQ